MPELPEVETVRRGLNQVTTGHNIVGGDVLLDRTIAHPLSVDDFFIGIQGAAIHQWHRRGKYLLAELNRSDKAAGWLGVHLRMTGQLLWLSPETPLQKHCRVRLQFATDHELRFVDQRTFGRLWWVPPSLMPEAVITGLQQLGPEPFSEGFSASYLAESLKGRQRPIKNALLDQSLVAGIGNIYADEALFLSHIQPTTLCSKLKAAQAECLYAAILQVLQQGIDQGGTTFSDFRNVEGINGNYGGIAWVYNRDGEPCRICQTPIQRIKLAGRSAHFCPHCQQ